MSTETPPAISSCLKSRSLHGRLYVAVCQWTPTVIRSNNYTTLGLPKPSRQNLGFSRVRVDSQVPDWQELFEPPPSEKPRPGLYLYRALGPYPNPLFGTMARRHSPMDDVPRQQTLQ